MRRRTSPVQQWVDSLPLPSKSVTASLATITKQHSISIKPESTSILECIVDPVLSEKENYISHSNMTVCTPITVHNSSAPGFPNLSRLGRDPSFQSDSSHCSSVESLLELRRADPEAVLLNLGFGGCANSRRDAGPLSRIPKRFLQPSKLKGIAINDFVKHQQETNESLDSTSLGYRGLTGSPYVAPSEIVQKIMKRLREHEYNELDAYTAYNNNNEPNMLPQQQEGKLSVLSHDNRQFLERPRSKSPDMRNKRMIIGQKSFAFGHDGDLIEINSSNRLSSTQNNNAFAYLSDIQRSQEMGPITNLDKKFTKTDGGEFCTQIYKLTSKNLVNQSTEDRDSIETVITATTSDFNINNNYNFDENDCILVSKPLTYKIHYMGITPNNNLRRTSEGSCERSLLEEEGRRFSDGVMNSMKQSKDFPIACSSSSTRRKSLKRQAKIWDADSVENISYNVNDNTNDDNSEKSTNIGLTLENRCLHCGKVDNSAKDEEVDVLCCYKRTSRNCWMEMEKVLQKNKKLEDVVAKSRKEMAEIRDMLSNVLSVRMEPGF